MATVICPRCGTEYSKGNFWSRYDEPICPDCHFDEIARREEGLEFSASKIESETKTRLDTNREQESFDLGHLVRAQNRTTHAIRSIAIVFIASPIIFILTSYVVTLSDNHQSWAGRDFAVLFGGAAEILVLSLSFSEFVKSEVKPGKFD